MVKEVFIDATYNTSRHNMHLYAIIVEELGYGIPVAYMLVDVPKTENTKSKEHEHQSLECNKHFFNSAKDLGLSPTFIHLDKDYAEISAAQVKP
jgi:MULE transposase domain